MIIWIQHSYAYFHTCGDRRPDYALPAFIPASPIQVAILYQWGKCFRPLIRTIENRTLHQIISYSSTRVDKRLLICFTGNKSHAAVVVREHHDGASHEVGPEDPLAGGIEVIAVGKGEHILSLIFSTIRIIQDVYHSKGTNNYTNIYLCTYCSRYALGESPVCCLKYLRKVNCSGKFSCSAICLIFIEPFSSINLA